MSGPTQEFLDGNGNPGADRQTVSAADVANEWVKWTSIIPAQFASGCSLHETNRTINERDTEASGKKTGGIFQLTLGGTATDVLGDPALNGFPELERFTPFSGVYTLANSCKVMAAKCERHLANIQAAVDKYNAANGIAPVDWSNPPTDVWAYLAIDHNLGSGPGSNGKKGALGSIATYGMNWAAFKQRNPTLNVAMDRGDGIYGDDCISGGPDFVPPSQVPAPLLTARNESRLRIGLVVLLLVLLVALQWPKALGLKAVA